MNSGVRLRLIALAAGVALMGSLIGLMTVKSQSQAHLLRARLNQVDSESFRIADQFREFIRRLNNALFDYGSNPDPEVRDHFLKASREVDAWIDAQGPKLATGHEKALMLQIGLAYEGYRQAAHELLARLSAARQQSVVIGDYAELRARSQRLFDLGQDLAKAHFESRGALLTEASRTITRLRVLVLVALAGLFLFGLALAWGVYRDLVAPLQIRLVENQTLIGRQEKLASLGLLAAGIAHEIRNPLTAIKAALFIQQKKLQPGTTDYADAKLVEREIFRLERIVSDFLRFARPTDPEMTDVPVGPLLQEVGTIFEPSLEKNRIRLVVEEPPPLRIRADVAQIKQVLMNLVQNAADAAGAAGKEGMVTLRARPERRHLENSSQNVVILEVADNGKGIPPEVEKRLFDPFFTTKESGTGLGLSIAAGIVHKHGGALQYQTQVDSGTTFGIILPQATA